MESGKSILRTKLSFALPWFTVMFKSRLTRMSRILGFNAQNLLFNCEFGEESDC